MIKVLLVDDSVFIRTVLKELLSSDPEIEVAGEAGGAKEAVEKLLSIQPDVVVSDIIMPGSEGTWVFEQISKLRPTPIIVVSSVGVRNADIMRGIFALGVVDVVLKPDASKPLAEIGRELVEKVRAASRIDRTQLEEYKAAAVQVTHFPARFPAMQGVVIATSAGGPVSLYKVAGNFSKNFFAGVVVAQHMPAYFINSFAQHIGKITPLEVKVAVKGDILFAGRMLFSPTNATLELFRTKKGAVADIADYKGYIQPDINRVIISCAEAFRSQTVLVVLSGMGSDGVKGAEVVKKYGGKVIVEAESTAGVYSGMPAAVVKSGFYDQVCPASEIAAAVEKYYG